ncbi:group 1 truncated hemoglobin GlbN [soil metagenome]
MSIYDEIGGAAAVSVAVDDFYQRVLADPQLVGYFEGTDIKRLKSHQRSFIAAAIGGPEPWLGRNMAQAHSRLNIQPDHFDRVVGHLVDTLAGLGVPAATIEAVGTTLGPLKQEIAPGPIAQAG